MENIELNHLLIVVVTANSITLVLATILIASMKSKEIIGFLKRVLKVSYQTLNSWAKDCSSETKW